MKQIGKYTTEGFFWKKNYRIFKAQRLEKIMIKDMNMGDLVVVEGRFRLSYLTYGELADSYTVVGNSSAVIVDVDSTMRRNLRANGYNISSKVHYSHILLQYQDDPLNYKLLGLGRNETEFKKP